MLLIKALAVLLIIAALVGVYAQGEESRAEVESQYRQMFERADSDDDKQLDKAEAIGGGLSETSVKQLDINRDTYLSRSEFMALCDCAAHL